MNVGDKIYNVNTHYDGEPCRIEMTDADGIEWHRYSDGNFSSEILEYDIVGKVEHIVTGNVPSSFIMSADYYVVRAKTEQEHYFEVYINSIGSEWFTSKEEAQTCITNKA